MMRNQDIQCVWEGLQPTPEDIKQILADHKEWVGTTRDRPPLPPHNLSGALLLGAQLSGASLWQINLSGANLHSADLSGANLYGVDLSEAFLTFTNLSKAVLIAANLDKATLSMTDLSNANVTGIRYKSFKTCRGIRADSCYGSPRFRRHVMDKDYIEELRASKLWRWLYLPWLISSNCGRSFSLWVFWSIVSALFFAVVYLRLGAYAFDYGNKLDFDLPATIYYSVVTFTTLGFGDVTPVTTTAQMWVMAEVILGYIMLGGLISIFANKFARRAG